MRFHLPSPRRSRHPLVRALSLLLGIAMLGVLLVFGLAVAGVLLVGGALLLAWRQWKQPRAPIATAARPNKPTDVLEGEFVVIRQGPVVHH
ncbi:MAG: hypothetical protein BGP10_02970 [Rhodanobacter sp. 68-29]|uniref:hypothetical protein n=1 Tax=Rhodanobacter sp. PCA2 TaxID=2006117 RepID=UPI00086C36B5|nr:hypothetical protein [Rhodanobacter sp. PCA2]MBA2079519.1 hypothetical protein [Rhodanobacter sp. PCA2]MBN8923003.1 hypothetical protein [Rhodanobacter sp.]ODU75372.1 MAG: hypothetical protein ABT17_03810 [Rhodanobacter sp. SCN 69-32]OJY58596.1 MAG: hypothetical protein BGP10_02970 [Rhodanobacter sp. 68-29]